MRARKWQGRIWAVRLGLLALALNALVPVHLAFDLAEAFEPAHPWVAEVEAGGAERRLLALLSGHRDADGPADEHSKHGHGQHHRCPVCSALGALAGFAPPTPTALSLPVPTGLPVALAVIQGEPVGNPAGYRSRAPPIA
jgi:hypothetical protein